MGMFFPCLVAAVMNGGAFQIFREPMQVGNGPLMALYIFIFSTFMLLWSIKLYPSNLRKIGKLQFIIEFLTAEFLMEDLIIDFWFPLEKCVLESLPVLAQNIEDCLSANDWSADIITDTLKNETCGFVVSYVMSSFFLIATLHASRCIDIRTFTQEGPRCFAKEIMRKIKFGSRRFLRKFGIGAKRRVKINELRNTHQGPCSSRAIKPSRPNSRSSGECDMIGPFSHTRENPPRRRFCPVHNTATDDSDASLDDFEDLGAISNFDFM